jgi:hypothetical protein
LGRAGAADELDGTDNHGHWRTAKLEVGRAARRELDPSKLADNDEVARILGTERSVLSVD